MTISYGTDVTHAEAVAESYELERKIKATQEAIALEQWEDDMRLAKQAITPERIAVLEFVAAALVKAHPAPAQVLAEFQQSIADNPDTFKALTGDCTRGALANIIDMIFKEAK